LSALSVRKGGQVRKNHPVFIRTLPLGGDRVCQRVSARSRFEPRFEAGQEEGILWRNAREEI